MPVKVRRSSSRIPGSGKHPELSLFGIRGHLAEFLETAMQDVPAPSKFERLILGIVERLLAVTQTDQRDEERFRFLRGVGGLQADRELIEHRSRTPEQPILGRHRKFRYSAEP